MSYGADASGQPLQPGEDEEGVCGGYAGASGEEAGGTSSGGGEGAERAAGHEGAGADAESLRAEMRRMDEAKVSGYEDYKARKLSRERFVEKKRALGC